MISLRFGGPPAVRLAISPVWELLGYALVLRDGRHLAVPEYRIGEWRCLLASVETGALDLALSHPDFVPDFMVPPPTEPFGTMGRDIERVEAAAEPDIARDLDVIRSHASRGGTGADANLDRWAGDPVEFRIALAAEMTTLWDRLVEPLWSAHRGVLEREVLTRGRDLALIGVVALLNELHADVRFEDETLLVNCGALNLEADCGPELLLVPSVLVWPKVFVGPPDIHGRPTLYYPARGAATMFTEGEGQAPTEASDALDDLLGLRRARILCRVGDPATTSELAERMDITASGVSQHLRRLTSLGLVRRTRVGRRVYYERTPRGDGIVELFLASDTARLDPTGERQQRR